MRDAHIELSVDRRTAELLATSCTTDLGEHQAAGAQTTPEESELLGAFLRELDRTLGGTGRMRRQPVPSSAVRHDLAEGEPRSGAA